MNNTTTFSSIPTSALYTEKRLRSDTINRLGEQMRTLHRSKIQVNEELDDRMKALNNELHDLVAKNQAIAEELERREAKMLADIENQ